ncbi:unnamed protein product [Polarella glacialis]|uniref:Uncharacterized protein n=1 Tax=Polarella glacialis TaxID=89957 RepID=A0A813H702_POLGL|nr:unnamed protein product [Polarella glacialis]CAE8736007.1 unnamed protein product [Polarella glacialis]|mmetsp:Transcript_36431/g.58751  ORF Transcript_36431/g.58751 Transcript_36431/m.58751 type:complete len:161 (-) Transcript_36431:94-576(-)
MWATQGIYPTADGWCPPAWPTNEDVLRLEEEHLVLGPKRSLVRRTAIVKKRNIDAVVSPDYMARHRYSLQVWPLRESSRLSGRGDNRSYACWVYYEPQDEQVVFRAWNSVDVQLRDSEREVVDPDTAFKNEQVTLRSKEQVCHFSIYEWDALKEGEEPRP